MIDNKNNNPAIEEFNKRLAEFERKIEEDSSDYSLEEEFHTLKDDAQDLYHDCYDETEIKIVDNFIKKLNKISSEQDYYNEEDERDSQFPNRTDNNDSDGDLDEGFSTDKYFGLD
jgi:hypothetical protein